MQRQAGDVVGFDDVAGREGPAQLVAAGVELIAEQARRQRGVHEPGRDQVDADGGELDRQAADKRLAGADHPTRHRQPGARPPGARAAHERDGSARIDVLDGTGRDGQRRRDVLGDRPARLVQVQLGEQRVLGSADRHEDVVDDAGVVEERPEGLQREPGAASPIPEVPPSNAIRRPLSSPSELIARCGWRARKRS